MIDLIELGKRIHSDNERNGWHDDWNVAEKLMMVVTECAEAVDEIRHHHESDEVYYNVGSPKPEGFPVEIADAIIRLLDIAEEEKCLDMLPVVILEKLEYNKTRGFRHGGLLH